VYQVYYSENEKNAESLHNSITHMDELKSLVSLADQGRRYEV